MPTERPPRIVIAGGTGATGRALGERLKARCEVVALTSSQPSGGDAPGVAGLRLWKCDLTSVADAEVALAGADVLVCLARTSRPPSRLVHGAAVDLDLLLADALARAVPRTSVKRVVLWSCGADDVREKTFRERALPLCVLRGDGAEVVEALESLALGSELNDRALSGSAAPSLGLPREAAQVSSVQRAVAPNGWHAHDVAEAYFGWLAEKVPGVSVVRGGEGLTLGGLGVGLLTLRQLAGQSEPDAAVFTVCGGALAAGESMQGRLEFRRLPSGEVLMALLGYSPALPWPLYRLTQAVAHNATMTRFGTWLSSQAPRA
jgi:hypothetical protein